jgi:toxin ParE1/3/4
MVLRKIYEYSVKRWGQKATAKYMAEIYAAMKKATVKPKMGKLRVRRAVPFLMVPAGKHFVVYDRLKRDIVILTLLHQRRDSEQTTADMQPAFLSEIEALKKELTG